jgi:hypothetical protein
MDIQDAERTGVAPFTRSGGRWREAPGVPTVPSLPACRVARFPKPRCNQLECHPPVRAPLVCPPEECPPPKCPPEVWPPPPPCCASTGATRHNAAAKARIMRVNRTRKAIRLAMAFPIHRESISSLLLFACPEVRCGRQSPKPKRLLGADPFRPHTNDDLETYIASGFFAPPADREDISACCAAPS